MAWGRKSACSAGRCFLRTFEWLKTKLAYQIEPATLAVAQVSKQVNLAKQALQIAPNISGAVNLLVA